MEVVERGRQNKIQKIQPAYSIRGDTTSQETFGDVHRHFWLLHGMIRAHRCC